MKTFVIKIKRDQRYSGVKLGFPQVNISQEGGCRPHIIEINTLKN